jgi:hypothetical protein
MPMLGDAGDMTSIELTRDDAALIVCADGTHRMVLPDCSRLPDEAVPDNVLLVAAMAMALGNPELVTRLLALLDAAVTVANAKAAH